MITTTYENTLITQQQIASQANLMILQGRKSTNDWLQVLVEAGEVKANEFIIEQAQALSADTKINPCEYSW